MNDPFLKSFMLKVFSYSEVIVMWLYSPLDFRLCTDYKLNTRKLCARIINVLLTYKQGYLKEKGNIASAKLWWAVPWFISFAESSLK